LTRHFSISLRLTLWFSAVFLTGFALFGLIMWADLANSLSNGRDKTLSGRAGRLKELLRNVQGDSQGRRNTKFADFAAATPEGNLIQVFDTRGGRVYPQPSVSATEFPWPRPTSDSRQYSEVWHRGKLYRVFSESIEESTQPLRILVAGQLEDNRQLLNKFAVGLFSATPLLIIGSALCGYFLGRRALDPVDHLTASVRSISIGQLSRRLPITPTGDELQRLAETCNDMLARLEVSVAKITRFTADASHELRSPVTYIRTLAEVALRNPDIDPESAESFRDIVRESEEASRLLEDMLTLARSDAGHTESVFEVLDLTEIVTDSCARIRPAMEAKQHNLSLHMDHSGPVRVTGDGASLRRLFWILLDNAVKYTPFGGEIDVSVVTAGNEASVSVKDNGIGIPPTDLPRIFERFYRVDSSRAQEEGTGLGLAIAKWISDVHHAVLTVESAENAGAIFRISFRYLAN
jgi:heavy metal sensor kinase